MNRLTKEKEQQVKNLVNDNQGLKADRILKKYESNPLKRILFMKKLKTNDKEN